MPLPANPPSTQIVGTAGILTPVWQAFLSAVGYFLRPVGMSGQTANRPVNSSAAPLYIGQPYFDTSLGYMVWVKSTNPTVWVNGAGTAV